jgi:hypothetical protein
MTAALDLDSYRSEAEAFCEALDREYYLHLAGHKRELEVEPIYERHRELFSRRAVEELRELADSSQGEAGRRTAYLLEFAVHGHLGLATSSYEARLAELEVELDVEVGGEPIAFRAAPVELANEADAARRAAISDARDALVTEHLDPVYVEALERTHELARSLGWSSYRDMCVQLRGVDLDALAAQTRAFLDATATAYPDVLDSELEASGLPVLGQLRRSDLPRFFRAPELDAAFPDARLVSSLEDSLAGIGIGLAAQDNVHLDTESRPTKSPRAFCAPARVPDEIYLVISPVGGHDDYEALFHEAGHVEHYAHTDAGLEFEYRRLGDNSVTESFAFLIEGMTSHPAWLESRLGVADPEQIARHTRAVRLVFLRRYAAKLEYELELHAEGARLDAMPARYSQLLGDATAVPWPRANWLADVDQAFYVACYLRAWALEAIWRRALTERFGESWFAEPAAGEWLRGLWRNGQRLRADELLAETLGEELDFAALAAEFASTTSSWP